MSAPEYPPAFVRNVQLNVDPSERPKQPAGCAPVFDSNSTESEHTEEGCVELENVTVKFRISEMDIVAQVYPNCMTLAEVKQDISRKFEVEPKLLVLRQENRPLCDSLPINSTKFDEFGIHEFELELLAPKDIGTEAAPKLDLDVYYDKHRLADFITVHIPGEDTEDGQPKNVVVEIVNAAIIKPFLCGYRDRVTGKEYLDAFSQTGPYFDKWKARRYYSRDTQTWEPKEKILNTAHEQSVQCHLDGINVLYVSAAHDFTIVPGKYQTFAQKERAERKLEKIQLIQRNWRRWILWKYIRIRAKEYRRLVRNREEEEERYEKCVEERVDRQKAIKQFPRSKDDFDLLYAEIGRWKRAELRRIAAHYEGPARISEVNILLDKEIQLLNGVERQRRLVCKSMKDFRKDQLLKKMGKPIEWIGYKDCKIHMDLLSTQRVRFLTEVYKDLRLPLSRDVRLTLVRRVMEILMEETCFPNFPELFDLFDREKNLLLYATSSDVEILRKRQNILFYELIKFQKSEQNKRPPSRMCIVCKKVKAYKDFAIRTRQSHVDTCKSCYYLKLTATENTVYQSILRCVQRDERKRKCTTSFAFVMQSDDVRHIIDKIWHGHSALSKTENLNELRLPRWIKSDDWAPWNCVCLTERETRDHYKIDDIEKVYDPKFILHIGNRHMLARSLFQTLAAVAIEFQETGQWWKVGMNQQRTSNLDAV
ncbi:IQ and ubiquitin-like domain-containing protein [Drosophila pseudoobscura]|uniref:IQ and ubiquitin-like domain-containing protein n=1 Tax=Drosophila pseudoobscura pseudoobscura TaxID=46245 RepID=A0A6I8UPN1_DROPS|nr:IQ and ubiquitin-like domain-containing protein [Drosophila pseudoobscura]